MRSMTKPHHVYVNGLSVGNDLPLAIIAGPCVMESRQRAGDRACSGRDGPRSRHWLDLQVFVR